MENIAIKVELNNDFVRLITSYMQQTAKQIQQQLDKILQKSPATVMLTGGRSAAQLYTEWQKHPSFKNLTNTTFYFGDERCVPPDHPESNYSMVMQTLFKDGLPNNCKIHRMQAEQQDLNKAAKAYERLLPNSIDILLLGIGEDGHIASLFPNSPQLQEQKRRCLPITGPKPPYKRLTVTPPVIKSAKITYILAEGSAKKQIIEQAKQNSADINRLPAQMTKAPIWCHN